MKGGEGKADGGQGSPRVGCGGGAVRAAGHQQQHALRQSARLVLVGHRACWAGEQRGSEGPGEQQGSRGGGPTIGLVTHFLVMDWSMA